LSPSWFPVSDPSIKTGPSVTADNLKIYKNLPGIKNPGKLQYIAFRECCNPMPEIYKTKPLCYDFARHDPVSRSSIRKTGFIFFIVQRLLLRKPGQHSMIKKSQPLKPLPLRLQGTDGIRREVRPSSSKEFSGLTPQQVFLERGFITEEFMELYAFAYVDNSIKKGEVQPGGEFVVGWDPRDTKGSFTSAVIKGIRRANANALAIGIVPTPLVPKYMLYKEAKGGFMVTASHNPKDQNGIKTFCAYRGMKLLPDNDIKLTRTILSIDYQALKKMPLKGIQKDCRKDALNLFETFSLLPENSWSGPEPGKPLSFSNIVLVVDPAKGSLSEIAAEVFRKAGFGRVIEVNAKLDGDVNLWSGVADLEGHSHISPAMIDKRSGHFRKHKAVLKLFELGRKLKPKILAGTKRVAGAVFDADGDRFYRLEYNPFKDELLVLSGDETAFLQAMYLIKNDPKRYKNALYINTVESDLNAASAAKELGFKPKLTAVGDKWILLQTAFIIVEARLKVLKKSSGHTLPASLQKKWDAVRKSATLNVDAFQKLEKSIDALEKKNPLAKSVDIARRLPFAVGSEETGHNITAGRLELESGNSMPVFFGNGLKSALNTFAATEYLFKGKTVRAYFSGIHKPFKPGFKQTLYVYYVKQEKFHKDSTIWKRIKKSLLADAKTAGFRGSTMEFPEDPDMLYISLKPDSSKHATAGIFVRNSGTENKISVNLRGDQKEARQLKKIGESAIRLLLGALKDTDDHYYKLELDVLSQVAVTPVPEEELILEKQSRTRVIAEMGKQKLIELTAKGYRLTARGKWYIASDFKNQK
jgi:phosphomannomutase